MSERKPLLTKYRNYFQGDISSMHSGFLTRFKDPEVTTPLSVQNFVTQNEIRAIIEKRISLMPIGGIKFEVLDPRSKEKLPELSQWLDNWLEGGNFGEGRSFVEFAGEILLCLELDGESALKLIIRNGTPMVRRIPDEALEIVTNPDNVYEVTSYMAKWTREVDGEDFKQEIQIAETIDSKEYIFESNGKVDRQSHNFGFIPLIFIKREDTEQIPHGRSGVADLIESQDNLNRCLTNIARANKYGPWGLYCTEDSGAPLPDGDVTVAPGSLVATPIRKVSGDGAGDCLFREKEEILDAMYRVAGISRDKASEVAKAGNTSGKALVILNSQGKRYIDNLQARLKRGLARLCRYALVMAGKISSEEDVMVSVTFPNQHKEDPSVALERAKLLFDMGLAKEALEALGFEPEKIEQMLNVSVLSIINGKGDMREFDA